MSYVPFTTANLLTFIKTDPRSIGLATIITAHPGQDGPIVDAVNDASGPGAGSVPREPIAANDFLAACKGSDMAALTSAALATLQIYTTVGTVSIGADNVQEMINDVFADYPTTKSALNSLATRPASPAEVYFGPGTVISISDVDGARNSGGGNQF
jgi:hypothetical protein